MRDRTDFRKDQREGKIHLGGRNDVLCGGRVQDARPE